MSRNKSISNFFINKMSRSKLEQTVRWHQVGRMLIVKLERKIPSPQTVIYTEAELYYILHEAEYLHVFIFLVSQKEGKTH